jgi:hypothetical protein
MTIRSTAIAAIALLVIACGGGQGTPTAAPTSGSGQTPGATTSATANTATTGPTAAAGEPIGSAQVQTAVDALKAQDSWQFEVTATTMGLSEGVQNTITGTQRTTPESAIDATHPQPGGSDFHYIRIGDAIWYDVGTDSFTEVQADDAENLIAQYEPYYLNGLAESMLSQDFEFEPVGDEDVSGVATTHYQMSEEDREDVTELLDIDPADWAGDVWIAKDGGHLMRMAWGPQSVEDAGISIGFDYLVTAVNCDCPIEPPA